MLNRRHREADRLRSGRAMATPFNASRGVVREAFTQLEQLGGIAVRLGGEGVGALSSASVSVLGPFKSARRSFGSGSGEEI